MLTMRDSSVTDGQSIQDYTVQELADRIASRNKIQNNKRGKGNSSSYPEIAEEPFQCGANTYGATNTATTFGAATSLVQNSSQDR